MTYSATKQLMKVPTAIVAGSVIDLPDGTTITVDTSGYVSVPFSYVNELFDAGFTVEVGEFSSATQGYGVPLTNTKTKAFTVYADDAGAVLWAAGSVPDIKASQSRLLLTKDNTGGFIRTHGFMGQLKAYDAFWNNEVVSALYGRMEIVKSAASVVLGGYGITAGVLGVVATSGAMTVDTNHVLAGVAAVSDFRATLTQTGITAAFLVAKYDTTNWSDATARTIWKHGMYIPSGTCTAGIVMGEKSSSAAIGHHVGVANSADTAGDKAIAVFADDANAVLASDAQVINARMLVMHAQNGNYAASVVRGHLRIPTGANIINSSQKCWSGVTGYIEASGTYTIGDGSNAVYLAALDGACELGDTPTVTANSIVCGVHLFGKFTAAAYTGETIGVLFEGSTYGFEHAFGFHDGVAQPITTASHSTNDSHKIAVWINGVGTRYIHLLTD